ncbi:MAG: hypothetical protein EOP55_12585 [Sphingobacteriales bacterium]|nr:MAG: hypothetical protein EOP55_12585 [Sphingobacteriales bacterium]
MRQKLTCKQSLLLALTIFMMATGCNSYQRDQQIKADITMKAKEDVNFAGLHFTVNERKLTIWGNCPTTKSKLAVLQKLKSIHVIKTIDEHIMICPVLISDNFSLKQQTDSILAKHPQAWADLKGNTITVYGRLKAQTVSDVFNAIQEQNPNGISINKTFSYSK